MTLRENNGTGLSDTLGLADTWQWSQENAATIFRSTAKMCDNCGQQVMDAASSNFSQLFSLNWARLVTSHTPNSMLTRSWSVKIGLGYLIGVGGFLGWSGPWMLWWWWSCAIGWNIRNYELKIKHCIGCQLMKIIELYQMLIQGGPEYM